MIKIRVQRQQLLSISKGTRDNESVKSFDDSCIIDNKLFHFNQKTGVIISGTVKPGNYIYSQKNGKITARYIVQEVL